MSYLDLAGKRVVVTGGTQGIGEAMVEAFVREGATVFFCGRSQERGMAVADRLGESVDFFPVDLTGSREVEQWFTHIANRVTRIDCLVNNAAIDKRVSVDELDLETWDQFFRVNIRAYFLCIQRALTMMPEGSSIINLGSITFRVGFTPMSAYVSTKGAIVGLTRSLARELGSRGIRVNTLSPGWTMTSRQLEEHVDENARELIHRSQCDPTLLQPEEVAEVALFLASPRSSAITGQDIIADKGWTHS